MAGSDTGIFPTLSGEVSSAPVVCLQCRRARFDSWVGKIPWRKKWQTSPVFLPGEFYGQRSLVDCHPQGHKESDTTEQLTLSLSRSLFLTTLHSTIFLEILANYTHSLEVKEQLCSFYFYFFKFIFILFCFTILYWFCHTLT